MNNLTLWKAAIAGSAGDVITTWTGIVLLGITEKNPFMNWLMSAYGVLPSLIATKVAVLLIGYILYHREDEHPWIFPAAIAAIFIAVTVINTVALTQAIV